MYSIYDKLKDLYDPYGFIDRAASTDAKLLKIIRANEAAIAESPELVNARFGLKLQKPKILTGFELEFTNYMDRDSVKEAQRFRTTDYFNGKEYHGNFEQELKKINIRMADDSIVKSTHGEDTLYKHEISTITPRGLEDNYKEYLEMLRVAHNKLGYFEFNRFSTQANYSIVDEANGNNFPLYNKEFRQLIGDNIIKFVDDALPLLDSKASVERKVDRTHAGKELNGTDRMEFFNESSAFHRCFYQLAYRNDDRQVPDGHAGPINSTARLELRRTRPGNSEAVDTICDPLLVAHALVTSAIRHSLETGVAEKVEPYHYRGGSYKFHLEKMRDSELLQQYLGKELVEELFRNTVQHTIRHQIDTHGHYSPEEFWGRS